MNHFSRAVLSLPKWPKWPSMTLFAIVLCVVILATNNAGGIQSKDISKTLPQLVSEKYQLYSGNYKVNELPWIFDGTTRNHGAVLDVWKADTTQTREACKKEWHNSGAYNSLCVGLENQKIIAVEIENASPRLVVYVPVSHQANVARSQRILFTAGHVSGDGTVHSLPRFVSVMP